MQQKIMIENFHANNDWKLLKLKQKILTLPWNQRN
jgi:hypothetical protein